MLYTPNIALNILGKELGYFNDLEGICNGITISFLEAALTRQMDQFLNTVVKIVDIVDQETFPEFKTKIEKIKNKIKNFSQQTPEQNVLTDEEEEYLRILAFFERISINQYPEKFTELFNSIETERNLEGISKFASSLAVEQQGGLKDIISFNNIYNLEELKQLFIDLAETIERCGLPENILIGFKVINGTHATAITYDIATKSYIFYDSNYHVPIAVDFSNIATAIFLSLNPEKSPFREINTEIIVLNNLEDYKLQQLQDSFNELKLVHLQKINTDILKRKSKIPLISMAAGCNDLLTVKKLLELGDNPSLQINSTFLTPLMSAVLYNNKEMMQLLLDHNADVNLPIIDTGGTPLTQATSLCRYEMMQILIDNGANVNHERKDSVTPLSIALKIGDLYSIAILLNAGAVLYKDGARILDVSEDSSVNNFLNETERNVETRLEEIQNITAQILPEEISIDNIDTLKSDLYEIYTDFKTLNKQFMLAERYEGVAESYKLLKLKISFIDFISQQLNDFPENTEFENITLPHLFNLYQANVSDDEIINLLLNNQIQKEILERDNSFSSLGLSDDEDEATISLVEPDNPLSNYSLFGEEKDNKEAEVNEQEDKTFKK